MMSSSPTTASTMNSIEIDFIDSWENVRVSKQKNYYEEEEEEITFRMERDEALALVLYDDTSSPCRHDDVRLLEKTLKWGLFIDYEFNTLGKFYFIWG